MRTVPQRTPDFGAIRGVSETFPADWSLEMFRRTSVNRYFELEVAKAFDRKLMKMPIYLSIGSEHVPAAIATLDRDFLIFAQHRCHSWYLSFGGKVQPLIDELLHRETGCARGMGGSASIHDPAIGMYGHSGLMGDQVPIAVGAAIGSGRNTIAVVGDASGEEDYVAGALGYAATKKAPLLVICEDNDLSILTRVETRRNWNLDSMARGFGMTAIDIGDDPWTLAHHVRELRSRLPALINVRVCRHRWHAGTGTDGPPEWNRFLLIKEELRRLGLEKEMTEIERDVEGMMRNAWEQRLPKLSN